MCTLYVSFNWRAEKYLGGSNAAYSASSAINPWKLFSLQYPITSCLWSSIVQTTETLRCRNTIRIAVRKQTGDVHHTFGGGVPFVATCFKTYVTHNVLLNIRHYCCKMIHKLKNY